MSEAATAVSLDLPKIIGLPAAKTLAADLLDLRGRALTLDASHVQRVSGLGLQVLLSARRTWAKDGMAFAIVHPSGLFGQCMKQLGASDLASDAA
jgi:chemotaxis protein CheX